MWSVFFIISNKDLSPLSNSIDAILLRPVADEEDLSLPKATTKERFMNFKEGGNILDLKRRCRLSVAKSCRLYIFNVRVIKTPQLLLQRRAVFGALQHLEHSQAAVYLLPGAFICHKFCRQQPLS